MIKRSLLKDKYKTFLFLKDSVMFDELFKDKDYSIVQVNDANFVEVDGKDIVIGFSGVFEWKGNKIYSLDCDSYTEKMPVIAYEEFYSEKGTKCLDILVESW